MHHRWNNLAADLPSPMGGGMDVHVGATFENLGALRVRQDNTSRNGAVRAEGTTMKRHEIDHDTSGFSRRGGAVNVHVVGNILEAAVTNVEMENVPFESEGAG